MEKEKRRKIFIFLIVVFIISFAFGILGLVKSFNKTQKESNQVKENTTVEEDVSLPKAYYKLLKLNENIFEGSKIKYDEETKSLFLEEDLIDRNLEDIKVYTLDNMNIIFYKKGTYDYVILYDEGYNVILDKEILLANYNGFYLSKYVLNERGLIFYIENPDVSCKDEEAVITQVVYFYEYLGKNKLSDAVYLDVKTKECLQKTN